MKDQVLPVWIQKASQLVTNDMILCSWVFSWVSDWVPRNITFYFTQRQNLFWILFIMHVHCLVLPFISCCLFVIRKGQKFVSFLHKSVAYNYLEHQNDNAVYYFPFWKKKVLLKFHAKMQASSDHLEACILDKHTHQMTWRLETTEKTSSDIAWLNSPVRKQSCNFTFLKKKTHTHIVEN